MHPTPRRTILLLFVFLLLFRWSTVFGQTQIQEKPPRITIAAEPDYPPYSFLDEEGNPTGFSVELFQAAARAMGYETVIRTDYWEHIRNDLAEGRIDALPLVGRTPERDALFDFTFPYLSLHGGVVVKDTDDHFQRFEDLAGRRIAVMAADNAEEFLSRQNMAHFRRTFPTFTEALEDLSAGGSDAVVIQRLVALRIMQEDRFSNLRLLDEPIEDFRQDFCFAVTRGDRELLSLLNEGLSLVVASGTFRRLQTKWFSPMELPSRRIVVGGDENYPPFEFLDEERNPAGYNVDLTRAIAREMGFEVEIRLGPWSQITSMLARGEIDLIQGMVYSPERDRIFDFSQGHTVHQHVVIARSDRPAVPSSVEELRGHSIVVQDGDIMHSFALQAGLSANLRVVDSQKTALQLVASGEIDFALGSRLTAMHLIRENGWGNLVVGRESLVSNEYGFAVLRGNMGMLSNFSEGLAVLQDSGEYRRIYDKWLGILMPAPYSFRQVSRVALMILVPVLIILVVIVAWNRSLRKQVSRSTAELQWSVQRTQWLNTIATSYLLRRSALSLMPNTVATLDSHFAGVKTVVLTLDANSVLKSEQTFGELLAGISLTSNPSLLELFRLENRIVVNNASAELSRGGVGALLAVLIHTGRGERRRFLAFVSSTPKSWSDQELITLEEHANMLTIILENETYQNMMDTANRTLASSLKEKETLLKEVHHRVKNNLNVIVSLLRLQEDQIESVESARGAFEQSRNRIYSMALVHESLYRSESLSEIELDQYIQKLVDQLKESFSGQKDIRYIYDLTPVRIDITRAVPCGIIINELISNAQKHAFPETRGSEITISLAAPDQSSIVLTIRDNGVGMPARFSAGEAKTLGLQLVDVLSTQIKATLTFSTEGGTRVDLRIPLGDN